MNAKKNGGGKTGRAVPPARVSGGGFDPVVGGFREIVIDGRAYPARHVAQFPAMLAELERLYRRTGSAETARVIEAAGGSTRLDGRSRKWLFTRGSSGFGHVTVQASTEAEARAKARQVLLARLRKAGGPDPGPDWPRRLVLLKVDGIRVEELDVPVGVRAEATS